MSPRKANMKPNKKLVAIREGLALTQTGMAEKLGVSLRMYQRYEAGGAMPKSISILVRLIEDGRY